MKPVMVLLDYHYSNGTKDEFPFYAVVVDPSNKIEIVNALSGFGFFEFTEEALLKTPDDLSHSTTYPHYLVIYNEAEEPTFKILPARLRGEISIGGQKC